MLPRMLPHQYDVFLAFVDAHFERLPTTACFVYCVLTSNANEDLVCFLSPAQVAAEAGLPLAHVRKGLAVLAANGLVERQAWPGTAHALRLRGPGRPVGSDGQ